MENYIQRIGVNSKVQHLQETMLLETARIHREMLENDLSSQVAKRWHLNFMTSYMCYVTTKYNKNNNNNNTVVVVCVLIIISQNLADFMKMFNPNFFVFFLVFFVKIGRTSRLTAVCWIINTSVSCSKRSYMRDNEHRWQ